MSSSTTSLSTKQQKNQSFKRQKPLWEVQDEFLQTLSPQYFRIRDDNDRVVFFNNLYARFFARWPEEKALFPGVAIRDLSAEQAAAVAKSVKRREKVVQAISLMNTLLIYIAESIPIL